MKQIVIVGRGWSGGETAAARNPLTRAQPAAKPDSCKASASTLLDILARQGLYPDSPEDSMRRRLRSFRCSGHGRSRRGPDLVGRGRLLR
jgi:hypothetical protein